MTANKTKATQASVTEFIEALPDPTRRADAKSMAKLLRKVTGEKPKMWGPSIIGSGSYHYKYDSGREGDMPLACFSPRKTSTVIYLNKGFPESATLLARLGKFKTDGGCLHIKNLADVDTTVLEALYTKSVFATREKYPA